MRSQNNTKLIYAYPEPKPLTEKISAYITPLTPIYTPFFMIQAIIFYQYLSQYSIITILLIFLATFLWNPNYTPSESKSITSTSLENTSSYHSSQHFSQHFSQHLSQYALYPKCQSADDYQRIKHTLISNIFHNIQIILFSVLLSILSCYITAIIPQLYGIYFLKGQIINIQFDASHNMILTIKAQYETTYTFIKIYTKKWMLKHANIGDTILGEIYIFKHDYSNINYGFSTNKIYILEKNNLSNLSNLSKLSDTYTNLNITSTSNLDLGTSSTEIASEIASKPAIVLTKTTSKTTPAILFTATQKDLFVNLKTKFQIIYKTIHLKYQNYMLHMLNQIHQIRTYIYDLCAEHHDNEINTFLTTLLIGSYKKFDYHTNSIISITGLSHILCISGLHISLIFYTTSYFLRVVFELINHVIYIFANTKTIAFIISIILTGIYTIFTGLETSAIRAYLMTIYFISNHLYFGNNINTKNISFILICMLIYNPYYIYDISFQLSFASVFAIIYYNKEHQLDKDNNIFSLNPPLLYDSHTTNNFLSNACTNSSNSITNSLNSDSNFDSHNLTSNSTSLSRKPPTISSSTAPNNSSSFTLKYLISSTLSFISSIRSFLPSYIKNYINLYFYITLFTFPIVTYHFQQISTLAIISNFFILPIITYFIMPISLILLTFIALPYMLSFFTSIESFPIFSTIFSTISSVIPIPISLTSIMLSTQTLFYKILFLQKQLIGMVIIIIDYLSQIPYMQIEISSQINLYYIFCFLSGIIYTQHKTQLFFKISLIVYYFITIIS